MNHYEDDEEAFVAAKTRREENQIPKAFDEKFINFKNPISHRNFNCEIL